MSNVTHDWPYQLLICLDTKRRITGIAQYTATVEVDNLKDLNPLPGREPRTCPPVDITEQQMRDIIGEGGDLVAGIASARTKRAEAEARLEEVTTSLRQTQEALVAAEQRVAEMSNELGTSKSEVASREHEMKLMQSRLDKQAEQIRLLEEQMASSE